MVAKPPGVMNVPGTEMSYCCARPFLFQPTSVTTKESAGMWSWRSFRIRAGFMGNSPEVWFATSASLRAARSARMVPVTPSRTTPRGYNLRAASRSVVRADFRSATAPISTG